MNIGNIIFLAAAFSGMLFMVMRIQRNRLWVAALVMLPIYLIYRWALYKDQLPEALIGLAIGGAVNIVIWLVYGRKNPPGKESDIKVIGMEQ